MYELLESWFVRAFGQQLLGSHFPSVFRLQQRSVVPCLLNVLKASNVLNVLNVDGNGCGGDNDKDDDDDSDDGDDDSEVYVDDDGDDDGDDNEGDPLVFPRAA